MQRPKREIKSCQPLQRLKSALDLNPGQVQPVSYTSKKKIFDPQRQRKVEIKSKSLSKGPKF
jgi:hypothetical protein